MDSKRTVLFSTVAVFLFGLIGCSTTQTGSPAPVAGASSTTPPAASSANANPLEAVQACKLLTNQEAAQFKPEGPGQQASTAASGAASDCEWMGRSSNDSSMAFGVLVRPTQGLNDINRNGGTLTEGDVNGRPADKFASNIGGKCLIALAVTPTARVDVSVVIGAGTNSVEPCQVASQIASFAEPRLPKYQG
jgi:uncharacterized protein DUF3558